MVLYRLISSSFMFIWLGLGFLPYVIVGTSNWFTFVSLGCATLALVGFVATYSGIMRT
jgi:hypothetical protein